MKISQLASAIYANITNGLRGITANPNISLKQLEDEIMNERLQIIREYAMKNVLPTKELVLSINCLSVDCAPLEKCACALKQHVPTTNVAHTEIPQLMYDIGVEPILYFGTIDKMNNFNTYTNFAAAKHQIYRRALGRDPYIYIDVAPNINNMQDCYIFGAPFLKSLSITAIFKDPRQLEQYSCCEEEEIYNITSLDNEIERRLVEKYVRWYRQLQAPIINNDQVPK